MRYNIDLKKYTGTPEYFQNLLTSNYMKFTNISTWNLDSTYGIYANKKLVGFIDFYVSRAKNGVCYAYINVLDLFAPCMHKGVGRAVLNFIFESKYLDKYTIANIYGDSHSEAIYWWHSTGANFDMSMTKLDLYVYEGYDAAFCLNRKKFLANYKP